MKDMKTRLRELRRDQDMTMDQLAKLVGSYQGRISDIESGKSHIKADDIQKYAEALGTTVSYLVTGQDPENERIARQLGFSNETFNTLKKMDSETLRAFELLINDPTFGMAWTAYLSTSDQGLWRNGQQIASGNEDIMLGNTGDYSGVYNVRDLVSYAREQDIIATIRTIKRSVKK